MGFPYNGLIAPAILLDNPGLTQEEFIEFLDTTHSSTTYGYKEDDPWDYISEWEERDYHRGLQGLANVLNLGLSADYEKFRQSTIDENKLEVEAPFLWPPRDEGGEWLAVTHLRNVLGEPEIVEEYAWSKLSVGSVWNHVMGAGGGVVTKILEERVLHDGVGEDDFYDEGPSREYKMEVRPISKEYKEERFPSEEEACKKWPQFHPENLYDWKKETGNFSAVFTDNFFWIRRDGRYYLDEKTFDSISAGFSTSGKMGYTDLIITAEAVKQKAWKLISYKGLLYRSAFFKDFPQSRDRYEKAVWDSHIALNAKKRGKSYSEFLRMRLLLAAGVVNSEKEF